MGRGLRTARPAAGFGRPVVCWDGRFASPGPLFAVSPHLFYRVQKLSKNAPPGRAGAFQALSETISAKGLFCALYADRASHYWHTPEAGGRVDRDKPTFGGDGFAADSLHQPETVAPGLARHGDAIDGPAGFDRFIAPPQQQFEQVLLFGIQLLERATLKPRDDTPRQASSSDSAQ